MQSSAKLSKSASGLTWVRFNMVSSQPAVTSEVPLVTGAWPKTLRSSQVEVRFTDSTTIGVGKVSLARDQPDADGDTGTDSKWVNFTVTAALSSMIPPPKLRPMKDFNPAEPAILHDVLKDCIVTWDWERGGLQEDCRL
jgi:hypothetical protein